MMMGQPLAVQGHQSMITVRGGERRKNVVIASAAVRLAVRLGDGGEGRCLETTVGPVSVCTAAVGIDSEES